MTMTDQISDRVCPWPGCATRVSQALWGCRFHWNTVPGPLRRRLLEQYSLGVQSKTHPTRLYLKAAHDIQEWIERSSTTARRAVLIASEAHPI